MKFVLVVLILFVWHCNCAPTKKSSRSKLNAYFLNDQYDIGVIDLRMKPMADDSDAISKATRGTRKIKIFKCQDRSVYADSNERFTRYLGGLEQTNGNAVVIYVDLETLREEGYYTNFESLLTIRNDLMINMGYPISTQRRAGR